MSGPGRRAELARGPETGRRAKLGALPVLTLVFVACAVVVELTPALAKSLVFEREAIERGELWRLLSGHVVHGTTRLALFDLAAFALFGAWIERSSRRLFVAVLSASALTSSLVVLFLTEYGRYIGSSALVTGFLVATAVEVLRSSPGRAALVVALTLIAFFAVKVVLESLGSWPALWSGIPPGYQPAVMAHLGGALGGASAAFARRAET